MAPKPMIEITPIQPDQVAEAKCVIHAVANRIFAPEQSVEEFLGTPEGQHWLDDVENYQKVYMENRGLLLVALDDGKIVGTGGIRMLKWDVAELKRLWLLEEYHGQGIGFRLVARLLDFARAQGYTSVCLQTSPQQERAIAFYKKLGFYEIPCYNDDLEEISMGIRLDKLAF
ncbi:MAG: GNAT family N-acetyltransferase [Anaerolineales bacterium]